MGQSWRDKCSVYRTWKIFTPNLGYYIRFIKNITSYLYEAYYAGCSNYYILLSIICENVT